MPAIICAGTHQVRFSLTFSGMQISLRNGANIWTDKAVRLTGSEKLLQYYITLKLSESNLMQYSGIYLSITFWVIPVVPFVCYFLSPAVPPHIHIWLTHLSLDKMAAISQTTFSNTCLWTKSCVFLFKFHWSLSIRVKLTISQHWFR